MKMTQFPLKKRAVCKRDREKGKRDRERWVGVF